MATLIPNQQWDNIRKLTVTQLRSLRACEVYDGDTDRGENYLFTLLPHNPFDSVVADNIKTKGEYLGMSNNSIYPLTHQEPELHPKSKEDEVVVEKYPNLTKARKARQSKRLEKVNV